MRFTTSWMFVERVTPASKCVHPIVRSAFDVGSEVSRVPLRRPLSSDIGTTLVHASFNRRIQCSNPYEAPPC